MTQPKVTTINRQDARFYVNPDDQRKVPGVTSVIGMLDKSFLQHWASKLAAEYAVDNLGSVVGMAMNDRQAAIDVIKGAARRSTAEASRIGTDAHGLFEKMAKGLPEGRVSPELRPYVDGFKRFLDEKQPEYVYLEETVWSDTHVYAGSFDAYAIIDGVRYWLDNKTTRSGVHPEVGLQLAAYANADDIIREDGSRVPVPAADAGAVIHVRPEGVRFVPVEIGPEMFDIFLALRKAFTYEKEMKSLVVGPDMWSTYESEVSGPKRRTPTTRRAPAARRAA